MISHRSPKFDKCFRRLPSQVQRQAVSAYRDFKRDPNHPALCFKPTRRNDKVYSVRVTLGWRALGAKDGNVIIWFWIGSHAEYMRLIGEL